MPIDNVLHKCYHPQPHVESIENVADFEHLFNPDVEDEEARYPQSCLITQMKNIRHVHAFMFHRNQRTWMCSTGAKLTWFSRKLSELPKVATVAVCMSHD